MTCSLFMLKAVNFLNISQTIKVLWIMVTKCITHTKWSGLD